MYEPLIPSIFWYLALMGSHHHQVAILVPDDKLEFIFISILRLDLSLHRKRHIVSAETGQLRILQRMRNLI